MLWYVFLVLVAAIAWMTAEWEERTPWPWAVGCFAASFLLTGWLGQWWFLAPFLSYGAVFAALWIPGSRDRARGKGGGRIVR